MALLDLLTSDVFNNGINQDSFGNPLVDEIGNPITYRNTNLSYGGPSKNINFNNRDGKQQPLYHLLDRVTWSDDSDGRLTNPDLRGGDHGGNTLNDFILRGGTNSYFEIRALDVRRITNFLFSFPQGVNFDLRQVALQLLNPQENQRTWLPSNTLASVAAAGITSFKRTGLLPEPVDTNYNAGIEAPGFLSGITNAFGGGYLDLIPKLDNNLPKDVHNNYGLPITFESSTGGSQSKLINKIIDNPFGKKADYDANIKREEGKEDTIVDINVYDKVNFQDVIKSNSYNYTISDSGEKDFVPFKFEVVDSDNPKISDFIVFRAFIENLSDDYRADHNEINFNGRGESFYTYKGFKRSINIEFKIVAFSRHEMKPLYRKLNYLAAQTAPNYSSMGRIRTPYMKVTVGDYFYRIPGILNSVNVRWNKNYPWEIRLDEEKDSDMLRVPQMLDVGMTFTPIHSFTPTNSIRTPYLGIGGESDMRGITHHYEKTNWLSKGATSFNPLEGENEVTETEVK